MLKIGIVLYKELFLAMTGQLRIVGGDQTPTAWRKGDGGTVSRRSFRTMTSVMSVMPMFFCAPPYVEVNWDMGNEEGRETYEDHRVSANVNAPAEEV